MGSTQYYCASSLDGYIAEADDTLAWLQEYEGHFDGKDVEPARAGYESFYEGVGALVMGSATYEFVLAELDSKGGWPYKGKPAWVLSSRPLEKPEGMDVRIVAARVRELYDEMMAAAGRRHLWVVGGGNVASQFADDGLLDELLLTVVPVVLGAGKPLFERRLRSRMRLTGVRPFDSGMVELRYALEA